MNQDVFPLGPLGTARAPQCRLLTRAAIASVAALALVLGSTSAARADELTERQAQIKSQLAQANSNVDLFSGEVEQAAAALQKSRDDLAAAQQRLAEAKKVRAQAQANDERLAGELAAAQKVLADAKAKVVANKKAVAAEARLIGASVRETSQQNSELLGLAAFTSLAETTGDVNSRVQWSTTIFNSTQAKMDRLTALQLKLEDAQQAADRAEQDVAAKKQAAEEQVRVTEAAEAAADEAENAVDVMVQQNKQATAVATAKLAAEQKRQASLDAENKAVAKRIADRIAAQKREAARQAEIARRKAEAERRAREAAARARAEAEAARKAAEAARARRAADAAAKQAAAERAAAKAARAEKAAPRTSTTSRQSSSDDSSSYFSRPVDGPRTSPYGMRFHPVLHVWKLHDGTDFGAECGTPIRAPRDGVVSERYYNGGYGNRLMIDHGKVGGHYLTTGMNHATRYVVGVGERVSRGQIVGYVGSTGYSTGCHLHLMVWEDGDVVNPMKWF